jgi:N-glycosylase/DNA lyase
MEFTVALDSPFSLEYTLESGQVFRWEKRGNWWYGVLSAAVLKVMQEGDILRCSSSSDALDSAYVTRYFRLDDDLEQVLAALAKDNAMTAAVQKFYGLRLMRQDPWECLASFVLATNSNIPRIKKMISAICERYGEPFDFEGGTYHAFPSPEALAQARREGLAECGLGYRAPFVKRVAATVAEEKVSFAALMPLGYDESREVLLTELLGEKLLLGVGPKVADCVLLYSLDKDEAFPIDVWIARALAKSYPRLLGVKMRNRFARDGTLKLSPNDYSKVSKAVRARFGRYAGYAQQYLYMAAREGP